jgi:ATP-dependent Clp protease adapter protein ClpS
VTYEYSTEALTITATAAVLSVTLEKDAVTPEILLLAFVQDDRVRRQWPKASTLDDELVAYIKEDPEQHSTDHGWSTRSMRVVEAASERSRQRVRFVSRGDLLAGLVHGGGLAAALAVQAPFSVALLDEADEAPLDTGDHLVLFDDSTTTMDFVVHVLREVLGETEHRAVFLMQRTHYLGHAHIGPFIDAEARARSIRALARDAGFPLRVETV